MLSRMIFLRTTRDALQEANGKLETSLDSIRMLSSTLSHDLKTPIKIQMNIMEMLQQGKFGDSISSGTVQEMLTAMLESKQFEHELVLNLVDLMRYKMQEERFIPKPFVINKLLTDIQTQLEPLARRKDQVLTVHPYPNKDEITADYFGLKRVLHNLVNNAIQHIGNGCRIEVKVQKRAGDYLFKVEDNGPGIPADVQEHLFTRFNRVSSSGLGLYITKQIVNRHGGNIWVESKPGEGTTFSFTLPASGNEEQ
jgi:signal transduction histidine kinase